MSRQAWLEAHCQNRPGRLCSILLLAVSAAGLAGCTTSGVPDGAASAPPGQTNEVSDRGRGCGEVCASGTLNIIWNGEPRYFLFDDQEQQRRLLIPEEVARAAGGPLRLNGKRVIVVGECTDDPPGSIRVQSIQLEEEGRPCKE